MIKRTVIGTLICLFSAGAALADRPPNAQERSSIETALKAAGFNVWEEIENDDGKWESMMRFMPMVTPTTSNSISPVTPL